MENFVEFWRQKTHVAQVLLVLAMLYCASSISVLFLALGVVRYIPRAYFNPRVLVIFSLVSFGFSLLLAAYHFSTFLNRHKRKEDHIDVPQADGISLVKFWRQKTPVSQALLILAMLYCAGSVNVLLLALGVVRYIPRVYLNPRVLIMFSLASFGFSFLLAAYHFSTFLNRRKRKEDHIDLLEAGGLRGKTA